jgi:hypothetical protein
MAEIGSAYCSNTHETLEHRTRREATYHKDKKTTLKRSSFAHFGYCVFKLVNNKLAPIQLLDARKIHNGWIAPWANS